MLDGYRLMIPGPTQVRQDVLDEMARPVVPHYGREWTDYYNETLSRLRSVFRTAGRVFPIPGSGSAALEAALSSILEQSEPLLVLSNGWFGERLVAIAGSQMETVFVDRAPDDEPISPERLREALGRYRDAAGVAVVHSESSSGLLNPVRDLAAVCRDHGLLFLVDGISSVGGIDLCMDDWGIDVCVTASQKCLEAPPGLGIVAVSPSGWDRIGAKRTRGWYLNLHVWDEFATSWADWHPFPVTQAVPAFRALRRALEHIEEEGLDARFRRHAETARWARVSLEKLGFEPVFAEAIASPTILAFRAPQGIAPRRLIDELRERHRILIAGGMGAFKETAFRIGNMGPQSTREQMSPVIDALAFVRERGGAA